MRADVVGTGSMTPIQRQRSIEYFMTNTDVEVFLVSLKAGGVALNLTEASRVFIVDPWWNPAAEWQSADVSASPLNNILLLWTFANYLVTALPPHRPKAPLRHHPSVYRGLGGVEDGDVAGEEGEYDQWDY